MTLWIYTDMIYTHMTFFWPIGLVILWKVA
jgi:hypothetical protein